MREAVRHGSAGTGWIVLALVAACGASPSRSPCGELGDETVVDAELFCLYDADDVRLSGGELECPREAPLRVLIDGSVACRAAGASDRREDLPPEVCASLGVDCGAADAGMDAGSPEDAGPPVADAEPREDAGATADAAPGPCPPVAERPVVEVTANIVADETWSCDARYAVEARVFVTDGATLTVEAGAQIEGRPGATLVVAPGGRLVARGSVEAPVVMTSGVPVGRRVPGDWRGLALLGRAPAGDGVTPPQLDDDAALGYGGDDPGHDCGTLEHVRVEFAGTGRASAVTLAGCGTATTVDRLHIHASEHNGLDLEGGRSICDTSSCPRRRSTRCCGTAAGAAARSSCCSARPSAARTSACSTAPGRRRPACGRRPCSST